MIGYFALFGGKYHHPEGGWNDLIGSFETVDQAKDECKGRGLDWWQVVELSTGVVVADGHSGGPNRPKLKA